MTLALLLGFSGIDAALAAGPDSPKTLPILVKASSDEVYSDAQASPLPVCAYYYDGENDNSSKFFPMLQDVGSQWYGFVRFYKVDFRMDDDPGSTINHPALVLFQQDSNGKMVILNSTISSFDPSKPEDRTRLYQFFEQGLKKLGSTAPTTSNIDEVSVSKGDTAHQQLLAEVQKSPLPALVLFYKKDSLLSELEAQVFEQASQSWDDKVHFIKVEVTQDHYRVYVPGPGIAFYRGGANQTALTCIAPPADYLDLQALYRYLSRGVSP